MKTQFQTFQHKLIKYTDTWGTAFSLGYLIKIRQTNKQTGSSYGYWKLQSPPSSPMHNTFEWAISIACWALLDYKLQRFRLSLQLIGCCCYNVLLSQAISSPNFNCCWPGNYLWWMIVTFLPLLMCWDLLNSARRLMLDKSELLPPTVLIQTGCQKGYIFTPMLLYICH